MYRVFSINIIFKRNFYVNEEGIILKRKWLWKEEKYNKLVRDNIPKIIEQNGEKPIIKILSDKEYKKELLKKLQEECSEVITAENQEQLLEELADVYEVLNALACIQNKTMDDVVKIAEHKKIKRGGFEKKIYLKKVITNK